MFSVRNLAAKQLVLRNTYGFALPFGKKRKPTPFDLEKYDVVVVGAGLGNVLASHLDAVVGDKQKIFLAYDNPLTSFSAQRNIYEQGYLTKFKSGSPTRQLIGKFVAHSDYIGVDRFNPEQNEVVLRNGRTIKYENLVIAIGQKENYHEIKGFDQAWADLTHPFYTNNDHSSWKTTANKAYRVHLNFNGGDAYFYIPPGNFIGEIQDYNFLVSKAIWDNHVKTGKLSWETSKLTIINPNKTFSKYFGKVNDYIKQQCYDHNINIQTDLTLVEVRKDQNIAVFRNERNGQLVERLYGHLYSLLPTTTHPVLKDAGLADSTGYLDVNPETLQHKKYENIFGVGDVLNVPTTKSFYGGLSQVAVVRHNVERRLNGQSINAKYDGYSKTTLSTSPSTLANVEHKYNGEEVAFSTDALSSSLRYSLYTLTGAHDHESILKFKSWGPPYYKFKKTFDTGTAVPESHPVTELQPEKKIA